MGHGGRDRWRGEIRARGLKTRELAGRRKSPGRENEKRENSPENKRSRESQARAVRDQSRGGGWRLSVRVQGEQGASPRPQGARGVNVHSQRLLPDTV
ncbi:hypothetical protein NDU88_000341 [Pleurodeles waltl]|uniref:Uncharacterized protein n=1 Tax=Pleurodeles waltl TaxID=8319 RepID=A0AAV7Q2Y9_PLEWA|nr:hypothetical protein NDU88_000341 [Pleurodeles waltl]